MRRELEPWEKLPGCSVPLLWETDSEEYPYWFLGSGFLVSFQERLFVVTADHCLRAGDPELLRILAHTNRPEVMPLTCVSRGVGPDPHEDYRDVAILTVDPAYKHPRGTGYVPPLEIAGRLANSLLRGEALTVRGFPHAGALTHIDYANLHITTQAASFGADYLGRHSEPFLHEMRFLESVPITNFNSMSGSPVFRNPLAPDRAVYQLAGMLLRAGGKLGRFLDSGMIIQALNKVV
jgi:hypothetical protein